MEMDSIRLKSKFNPRLVKIHSSFLTGHQVLSRVQASRRPITQPTLSGVANVAEIETRHRKNPSWLTRLDSPADYHNCLFYGCRRGKEEEKKRKKKIGGARSLHGTINKSGFIDGERRKSYEGPESYRRLRGEKKKNRATVVSRGMQFNDPTSNSATNLLRIFGIVNSLFFGRYYF